MSLLRKSFVSLSAVIGAALVASAGALAADMPGDRTIREPARLKQPDPEYAGWYLRGDVGYTSLKNSGVEAASGFPAPTDSKLNTNINASIGGGYKAGWLRADVTADFIPATNYTGQVVTPGDVTAKVTPTTLLLNGYIDLGSWYGMTPYIGAGVGTANIHISNYTSSATPPFSAQSSRSRWNLAWAGMAGVAYSIAPNLLLDVGYRYLSLGEVSTTADAFGSFKIKGITAHEVRVGLRWNFDDSWTAR